VTFDLILNGSPRLVMDYPCDKFGDYSFRRFGSIVQTNRHTHRQMRMNALLPSTWVI